MDAVKFVEERRRMFTVTGANPKYSLFNLSTRAGGAWKVGASWRGRVVLLCVRLCHYHRRQLGQTYQKILRGLRGEDGRRRQRCG